ncbi:MAG TPA: PQQ-binding-like beta-propeller repeat protein [Tepidisphaeraceae bacterium]
MRRVAVALAAASLLWITSSARAGDWPRFRGPTGQGISAETGLPMEWSAGKNVRWKTAVPGLGWSSPIVWGDRVFLTSTSPDGVACHVICVNKSDGRILWDKQVFEQEPTRKEGKNSYATPTPTTDGKHVFAVFSSGGVVSLDFDGSVAWTNLDQHFYSRHGLAASPVLYNDLLIMPYDGSTTEVGIDEKIGWQKPWDKAYILAFEKETGKVRWRANRGLSRQAHVTPQVIDVAGRPTLISPAGDVVQGFNPDTGERLWSAHSQGEGVVPTFVTGGALLFTSSGFEAETIRAFRLDAGMHGNVTKSHLAWEQKKAVPIMPSFLYHDGLLFTIKESGIAQCLDAKTGQILWHQRLQGTYSASPVYSEGRIYMLSEQGETTVFAASREGYKELARNPLEGPCQASPAVSDGNILVRSEHDLFCISNGR